MLRNCESHDDAAQRCVNDAVVILEAAISNSYWGCSITKPAYTSWPHTFYFAYTDKYYISCSPWSDKAVNERQFNYLCDEFGYMCALDNQSSDPDVLIACMRDFFLNEGSSSFCATPEFNLLLTLTSKDNALDTKGSLGAFGRSLQGGGLTCIGLCVDQY